MGKNLVIVESPAKAKTITRFLGANYTVRASMGHVRDLPKQGLGVEVDNGSFQPTYVAVMGRGKTISEIKTLAKEASQVFLATDPDREGEAIAWHIMTAAGLGRGQQRVSRVEFHEITQRAITNAINNPRQLDMNLVNAQQARRVLDRLVGYKLSPLLWNKVQKGTSAGRVQSVALRIVIEREREIEAFVPREFWTIEADLAKSPFSKLKADVFHAAMWNLKENRRHEFENGDQAGEAVAKLEGAKWSVGKVTKKEGLRRPSAPFITSTLQQEAARKLRMKTQDTMKIAQQLYEGVDLGTEGHQGLITYMRTDSTQVAYEAQMAARDVIKEKFGPEYLPDKPPFYAKKAKGAQEAHEAIRPTKPARLPEAVKPYLTPAQFRLYQLIWRRFVASQMAPARVELTTVDIEARPQPKFVPPEVYPFRATGERILFPGFLAVYREGQGDNEEDETDQSAATADNQRDAGSLPKLEASDPLDLLKLSPEQHFTEPPPRYGEASLIKALEELGVGRPSTYATIMSTIRDRGYVVELKDGKERKFHPTQLGRVVNDLLVARFPDLLDVQFTARLEGELDEVAEGKLAWTPLVASVYKPMMEQLATAQREVGRIEVPVEDLPQEEKPAGRDFGAKRGGYSRGGSSKGSASRGGSGYQRSGAAGGSYSRSGSSGGYKRTATRSKATTWGDGESAAKPWEPKTTDSATASSTATRPRRTTRAPQAGEGVAPVKKTARSRPAATQTSSEFFEERPVKATPISTQAPVASQATAPAGAETCPLCHKPMVKRKGPYGEFMGCTGFPKCKATRKL